MIGVRPRARGIIGLIALFVVTTNVNMARAGEPTTGADDRARAQQLFESALADAEAGRYADACPKFAASHQTDPKTSTLLNLGRCYESLGRTASAWGAFREAEAIARKGGRPDLEAAARSLAEGIAPKLVRLTIVVPEPSRAPALVVSRDGRPLTAAEWGIGIPVDPGEHEIGAEARGRAPWRTRITVRGESRSVQVPVLEMAPASTPANTPSPRAVEAAPSAAPKSSWWTPMRTTGVGLAAVGATSVVVGLTLGFVAKSNYDDARGQCGAVDDCPSNAVRDGESARSMANGATIVMLAGAAVTAVGGALVVLGSPSSRGNTAGALPVQAAVRIGPSSIGLTGSW